jgi:hypothetical protein
LKTYTEWEAYAKRKGKRNITFEDYCKPGDAVDAGIVEHFRRGIPPTTDRGNLFQSGEAYSMEPDDNDILRQTFTTFHHDSVSWRYCGKCFAGEMKNRME